METGTDVIGIEKALDIEPTGFSFSGDIGKLAEAMAKAQSEIRTAVKDSKNPFYKSSYADLTSVWDACRGPLSKNGLAVLQPTTTAINGEVELVTFIIHSSGQWVKGTLRVTPGKMKGQSFELSKDPQSLGSAITYARRYGLASMVGVAPEGDDDDGEKAMGRTKSGDQLSEASRALASRMYDFLCAKYNGKVEGVQAEIKQTCKDEGLPVVAKFGKMTNDAITHLWKVWGKEVIEFEGSAK